MRQIFNELDQQDTAWVGNLVIKMPSRTFIHHLVLMTVTGNDSKSVWKNRKKKRSQLPCPASQLVAPQGFPLLPLKTADLSDATATPV